MKRLEIEADDWFRDSILEEKYWLTQSCSNPLIWEILQNSHFLQSVQCSIPILIIRSEYLCQDSNVSSSHIASPLWFLENASHSKDSVAVAADLVAHFECVHVSSSILEKVCKSWSSSGRIFLDTEACLESDRYDDSLLSQVPSQGQSPFQSKRRAMSGHRIIVTLLCSDCLLFLDATDRDSLLQLNSSVMDVSPHPCPGASAFVLVCPHIYDVCELKRCKGLEWRFC